MTPNPPDNPGEPPRLAASEPPAPETPPPSAEAATPLLAPEYQHRPNSTRAALATILNVFLWLFLADALVSLADNALILFFGLHLLGWLRVLVCIASIVMAIGIYLAMAVTPLVPKRLFLPLTLFYPAGEMFLLLVMIYFYNRTPAFNGLLSLCQTILGLAILWRVERGLGWRWRMVRASVLEGRGFSGWNLAGFIAGNVFLLLPAILLYLAVWAGLALHHFSAGFLSLRPGGISVQVRTYARNDGKTVQLYPMAHVADAEFFDEVSQSFPTNSVILMEGVTDEHRLLTNQISYKKLATSLGLSEQHEGFKPTRGHRVRADIDIDEFSSNTIAALNLVMLVHNKGVNDQSMALLQTFTPPPDFPRALFEDLLGLRNRHLLGEIQSHLGQSDCLVIPWGAAHMPGIARGLEQAGFHLTETREVMVIHFHFHKRDVAPDKPT